MIIWLRHFFPAPTRISQKERIRSSVGALIGVVLTACITHLVLGPSSALPLLLAPMGASAVLLFALPASPLAQPWPLIAGNTLSALIGVSCHLCIDDQVAAASVAIALSITAMFALRCVHPPSGAVALTAVLGGASIHAMGYHFVLLPVAINSLALLVSAIAYHSLTGHRYPHRASAHSPAGSNIQVTFTRADLDAALRDYNEVLDIDVEDLRTILGELETRVFRRHLRDLSCASVMTTCVKCVTPETTAQAAWELLHANKIKAVPVIDPGRHVVGIVTTMDFIHHSPVFSLVGLTRGQNATRHPVPLLVGDMMSSPVKTARMTDPLTDLVPLFASYGHHHLPVIDVDNRLAGMVTQANVVTGLYRQNLDRARAA